MPTTGVVPELLLTVVAAATVFTVMFALGRGIVLREFPVGFDHPALTVIPYAIWRRPKATKA